MTCYKVTFRDWRLGDQDFHKIIFATDKDDLIRKFRQQTNDSADIVSYKIIS